MFRGLARPIGLDRGNEKSVTALQDVHKMIELQEKDNCGKLMSLTQLFYQEALRSRRESLI